MSWHLVRPAHILCSQLVGDFHKQNDSESLGDEEPARTAFFKEG